MYYLYIVKCADGTLYTGITVDLERRIDEHNSSKLGAKYTRCRRPVELLYSRKFRTRSTASKEEYRIKSLSRKDKMEIINSGEEEQSVFELMKTREIKNKKITSVLAVAFNDRQEMLSVNLFKRGWDLPGGHTEDSDKDIFETVKRETMEEAFVEIGECRISSVVRSYHYDHPTYMVIVVAKVGKHFRFKKNDETTERRFMKPEEFLKLYDRNDEYVVIEKVIERAVKAMGK